MKIYYIFLSLLLWQSSVLAQSKDCSSFGPNQKLIIKNKFANKCVGSMNFDHLEKLAIGVANGCLSEDDLGLKSSSHEELKAYLPSILYQKALESINSMYEPNFFQARLAKLKKIYPEFFKNSDFESRYISKMNYAADQYVQFQEFAKNKNCETIDNRTDVLKNARNQEGIGWCFAFSAADMISFKLNKKVSAVDVAVAYYKDNNGLFDPETESISEGGRAYMALESAKSHGVCEMRNESEEIRKIDKFNDDLVSNYKNMVLYNDAEKCMREVRPDYTKVMCINPDYTDDYKPLRTITRNLEAFRNFAISDDIQTELNFARPQVCRPIRPAEMQNIEFERTRLNDYVEFSGLRSTIEDWDKALNNKQVFELSYSSDVLNSENTHLKGGHSSLIVGRRKNPKSGKCEYLLRNSWGNDAKYPNREYDNTGGVWVPMDQLLASAASYTILK